MSKYGSVQTRGFASKLEAAVYQLLQFREKAGEIKILRTQEPILVCGILDHACNSKCKIQYLADFSCQFVNSGELFFVEAKGFQTEVWRIKRRLWMHFGPGALEIWQGSHRRPVLTETIYPGGLCEKRK